MNNPSAARAFVFVRDRGVCAHCGDNCFPGSSDLADRYVRQIMNSEYAFMAGSGCDLGDWEVDHIHPLVKATDPKHWQMGNLQTLCLSCHKSKTAIDLRG